MAGSQTSDADIFTVRLAERLGEPVYNVAGVQPANVLGHPAVRDTTPDVLVLEFGESQVRLLADALAGLGVEQQEQPPPIDPRRLSRFLRMGTLRHFSRQWVGQVRFSMGYRPPPVPAADRTTGMLFQGMALQGQRRPPPAAGISRLASSLVKIERSAATRGTRLLILLVPDKENVYSELVPSRVAGVPRLFLPLLGRQLSLRGIAVVELTAAYRSHAARGAGWLYYLDDSHWSPLGISLAADHVADRIQPWLSPASDDDLR